MSVKSWLDNKLSLFKGIKAIATNDTDALSGLIETFLTPETAHELLKQIAASMAANEEKHQCELVYLLRRNGSTAFVDVVKVEKGLPVATVAQYTEKDLFTLFNTLKNDTRATELPGAE